MLVTNHLSTTEASDLDAICSTILPTGPDGPGSREAGVLPYILGQLVGPWGRGERMFRQGPFVTPDHNGHGWQSPMTPLEAYRYGLATLRRHALDHFLSPPRDLSPNQLEELVTDWASDRISGFEEIEGIAFFSMVRSNVAEGLFSDPRYGGNREMVGWRWIGYPGVAEAHGSYAAIIDDPEASVDLEPRSLAWH